MIVDRLRVRKRGTPSPLFFYKDPPLHTTAPTASLPFIVVKLLLIGIEGKITFFFGNASSFFQFKFAVVTLPAETFPRKILRWGWTV